MNTLLLYAGVFFLLGFVLWLLVRAERALEQERMKKQQAEQTAENLRKRIATDDELAKLSPDDLRRRLDGWLSDDG